MTNSFELETCLLPQKMAPDRATDVGALVVAGGSR
jgi:hypothetical protein